jgi:hypothetical protein
MIVHFYPSPKQEFSVLNWLWWLEIRSYRIKTRTKKWRRKKKINISTLNVSLHVKKLKHYLNIDFNPTALNILKVDLSIFTLDKIIWYYSGKIAKKLPDSIKEIVQMMIRQDRCAGWSWSVLVAWICSLATSKPRVLNYKRVYV